MSFLQATDLGSDTDDDDYVPDHGEGAELSVEENSGDDEGGASTQKKKKTKKKVEVKGRGAMFHDETEEDKERKEAFAKEEKERKEEKEAKKVDDLWAGEISRCLFYFNRPDFITVKIH